LIGLVNELNSISQCQPLTRFIKRWWMFCGKENCR